MAKPATAPVINSNLLPNLSDLPPPPAPQPSGNYLLGVMVGFQLVNCTSDGLNVQTFDQKDNFRTIPNKTYTVGPKGAINCMAAANNDAFDIQYTVNNNSVARARQSTRVFAIKDPVTGAITLTEKAPTAAGPLPGLASDIMSAPSKLLLAGLNLPKSVVFGIAKSTIGEANFNLLMGLAGVGQAGFHIVNGTDGPLRVDTYNQGDTVYLAAFKTYNIAPGQEATCEATPAPGAVPQGIKCRLNSAPQPLFVVDGALRKAVKDPATGNINLVEEPPVVTVMRLLGKVVGADRVNYITDVYGKITGMAEKTLGGFVGKGRVNFVKDLSRKIGKMADATVTGILPKGLLSS